MRGNKTLQKLYFKSGGFLKKNAPTILTAVGAIGVVTTSVLTAKATVKAVRLVDEIEKSTGEKLTKKELINIAGTCYIPAAVSGLATMFCIFGANTLNKKKQTALVTAYGVLDRSYKEYKEKLEDLYGKDTVEEVEEELAKDKQIDLSIKSRDEELLFFDEFSNRYFWKTIEEVREAEYHFNRNFALRGYAELNEFYEFLGLEPTAFGAVVGWSLECGAEVYGYSWIDFYHEFHESYDDEIESYYTICMPFGPTADYLDWE